MYYNVDKINSETEQVTHYGIMCKEDMLLVTRGYKEVLPAMYDRNGSKYFYIVQEVE